VNGVALRPSDGVALSIIKRVSRLVFERQMALRLWWLKRQGEIRWKLGGDCQKCAACCEEPSLQVDRLTWHLRAFREPFLWWQRVVNGFELVSTQRPRVFVFRCHYFDTATRRCTSYSTRPGICRDYPRFLLQQAWPEFLPGCGYRAVSRKADQALVSLGKTSLSAEEQAELRRKLRLD
jgi:hypothetical protein